MYKKLTNNNFHSCIGKTFNSVPTNSSISSSDDSIFSISLNGIFDTYNHLVRLDFG